jgi:adenylyltransferase/sulfurtransferase
MNERINSFNRYRRQTRLDLIGEKGQNMLADAKVLIVGIGGLGCPAAQYLTAAGVGSIGLMDHDIVQPSNLHRQCLYRESDVGKPKAECAKHALEALNSDIQLTAISEQLSTDNAIDLFEHYDLVIDGSDNFQTKYLINDASVLTDTPWIYASIYKFQGQMSVFNYQNGPTYRCLFPTTTSRNVSCEEVGVIGPLPGVLGTMQAAEAIKIIVGVKNVLSDKLKVIDLISHQDQLITVERDSDQIDHVRERGLKPEKITCQLDDDEHFYLDVRDPNETPDLQTDHIINIPMSQLEEQHAKIPSDRPVYVVCQTGKRSAKAVEVLRKKFGFTNVTNVDGGIEAIMNKKETYA